MNLQPKYGSHLPALLRALREVTSGPVAELGAGLYSTPVLHWTCSPAHRPLVTFESDPSFYDFAKQYADEWHQVVKVEDWDRDFAHYRAMGRWAVALVDHNADRRTPDLLALADHAMIIVVHDTDWRNLKHYPGMTEALATFPHRWDDRGRPQTTVVSRTFRVEDVTWIP